MIIVEGVYAGYNGKTILENVNLELKNRINIILGPNGAGKTTLFRVITGVLKPYQGEVLINGEDVNKNESVKKLIGYLPHKNGLFIDLNVMDNLIFYSKVYGLTGEQLKKRLKMLSELLELDELLKKRVSELSFGQQRRVALARVLLHDPQILILDEPTNGLDPIAAKVVRDYLVQLAENKLVVMSTHNLNEAMELADSIAIIYQGKILGKYSRDKIADLSPARRIRITYRGEIEKVKNVLGDYKVTYGNNYIEITLEKGKSLNDILAVLLSNNISIINVNVGNPLEDLLIRLVKGENKDAK